LTKAARILELHHGILTDAQIADLIGCARSYVRTVRRQRKGAGQSENDRRYLDKPGILERRRAWMRGYMAARSANRRTAEKRERPKRS